MKTTNCYWIVKANDPDIDRIIYTSETYKMNEIITIDGEDWRVIDLDCNI